VQKVGFFIIIILFCSFDVPKLKRVKVTDNISVLLPKTWHPMDQLDLSERYPSVRAPIAAYTDINRQLDFSINISATQWPDADLEIAKQFFKASLHHMSDRVQIIHEGVHEVNGKQMIFF